MESLWLSEHTVLDLPTLVPPLRERPQDLEVLINHFVMHSSHGGHTIHQRRQLFQVFAEPHAR